MIEVNAENTAQAFLDLLALRGIEYFFGNAGTDFASIVDAFTKRKAEGKDYLSLLLYPMRYRLSAWHRGNTFTQVKFRRQLWQCGCGHGKCPWFT
jgi:acetolactate synthase-1/2/3 large subunit